MAAEPHRQHVVDRLRGCALLGVLLVNTPFLLTSVNGVTDASMPDWWDRGAALITWTLFQAKSYVIFSFLFGYSLTILLASVTARGMDGTRVYGQRLLALLLIGAVHAAFLFVGDILAIYALLGPLLLWLRTKPDRTVWRVALALFALQVLVLLSLALLPEVADVATLSIDRSWREDGLLSATRTRLSVWPTAMAFVFVMQGPLVAALFCVGLIAGRNRWLADPDAHRPLLKRIERWGYGIGLPTQLIAGVLGVWPGVSSRPLQQYAALVLMYCTAPILSAAYVATIAQLERRGFARAVEADGRMSLTIYLGESLLLTTLAAGWGAGWYGMRTASAFVTALGVWFALLAFANWWGRRFGVGPAERVLRWMTYAGLQHRGATTTATATDR